MTENSTLEDVYEQLSLLSDIDSEGQIKNGETFTQTEVEAKEPHYLMYFSYLSKSEKASRNLGRKMATGIHREAPTSARSNFRITKLTGIGDCPRYTFVVPLPDKIITETNIIYRL